MTDANIAVQGKISPTQKFVRKGCDVTFYCTLNVTGLIEDVTWNVSTEHWIPGIVNDMVSKVTIPNLSADTMKVTCSVHISSLQLLDEVNVQSGYPPEAPKNISCIYFHKQNVTCSWNPGRDPKIPTDLQLTVPGDTKEKCSGAANSCSFLFNRELFRREFNVQLELKNGLGNATRQFRVNTTKIVKMDPPEILSLETSPGEEPTLSISWRRPTLAPEELGVKCSLRYRELQEDQWDYTSDLYMEKEKEMSYNLSGLHVYAEYVVSLRCIGSSGQVWWSDWSGEHTGRTAEQAPLHSVELWRSISCTGHTRQVYLRWKESSSVRSPGVTLGYNIQWYPEDRLSDTRNNTTRGNEMILNITQAAHIISVTHFNSAGWSPKATLRIPAVGEKHRQVISSVQISTAPSEDTTVTWTVTDSHFHRFVLDWCIDSGVGLCNLSFQYVENSSKWTIKKGILEPYKRYKISVYPLREDRTEAPYTRYFYVKEGAPLQGPNAKVEKQERTEVTIRWDPLRPDQTNGFITAFSIVYKPRNGHETVVTVNSDVYEYSLCSLMPNTLYSAYVVASTSAGNTSGNHIQFHTVGASSEYIGAVSGVLVTCLLLLLVLGITYKRKREKIKNLLWPQVPDPSDSSISGWPSDWLQVVQLLNPEWTEGALHSGDLHILHSVYVNDKIDRALLLPDLWGSSDTVVSMDESSIVLHYAATETCPEPVASTLLLNSDSCPLVVRSSYSQSSLHEGRFTAAGGAPPSPDLLHEDGTATVNPYLKNSVRTREVLM
ncbi:interleukin-31 receptor subunit alpha [Leptodactylus fuscus]